MAEKKKPAAKKKKLTPFLQLKAEVEKARKPVKK